eukprot:2408958-Amphidinium_carterae.3
MQRMLLLCVPCLWGSRRRTCAQVQDCTVEATLTSKSQMVEDVAVPGSPHTVGYDGFVGPFAGDLPVAGPGGYLLEEIGMHMLCGGAVSLQLLAASPAGSTSG